jgi:hypothetical protein
MIRPVTCLCLLAAGASGLYLYSEKHRTALLDREIGQVIRATEAAHARTGMLRAEWALLNEPGRLQDMASRYLTLQPLKPSQFVQVADLAGHLPAPMATPAGGSAEEDDVSAAAPTAAPPPAPADVAQSGIAPVASAAPDEAPAAAPPPVFPAHHPMQPPAKPDPHAGVKLLARADARHAPHRVTLADRQDAPLHDGMLAHSTPLPLASPQPMGASVYSAMARPMRVQPQRPAIVAAVPSFAVGSALGGGASLPPPVPYGR